MKKILIYLLLILAFSCKKENQPPTCEITQPENNASFELGEEINILVEASDPDGLVHEVQIYFDGIGLESLSEFPYNYTIDTKDYSPGGYTIKATALDEQGLTASDEINISINPVIPTLTTSEVTTITDTTAISGGNVTDDGGADIILKGICWDVNPNPIISSSNTEEGTGIGEFTSDLTGLESNTTYYLRAYAINSAGIAYGNEINFTTLPSKEYVIDYDGNIYSTVQIGEQIWMAENLKATHYADGTEIPNVTNDNVWDNLGPLDKAWCYYNNIIENGNIYGVLYTWAATMNISTSSNTNPSGIQGVCPDGWHLPSNEEWIQLEMSVGMSREVAETRGYRGTNEGSKLAGNDSLWNEGLLKNDPEFGTSGFNALPSGSRHNDGGYFSLLGSGFSVWTSTETSSTNALRRTISIDNTQISHHYGDKALGRSVRCIKD